MRSALRGTSLALILTALTAGSAAAELKVGDMAPNFKLQATDGKTYSLSDFRGKQAVVLAWFPAAFTRGCTIECKSLAENGDMIRAYDVTYFMASVDPIDKNIEFAKATSVKIGETEVSKKEADFPLLSDPSKEAAKAYGVLNEQRGWANRWTFYIAKDGKILHIDKDVQTRLATSAEDMAAKLKELKIPPAARRTSTR
jgi:peroxiredoxin Q/BCP